MATYPQAERKAIRDQMNSELFDRSPELAACADIANGFKHLLLDGPSYVTGRPGGHAEVISQGANIGVEPAEIILVGDQATVTVTRSDGSVESISTPTEPLPPDPAPVSSRGYTQVIFVIDVGGQHCDAQEVAAKAVAAWDDWLQGDSPIAIPLRIT